MRRFAHDGNAFTCEPAHGRAHTHAGVGMSTLIITTGEYCWLERRRAGQTARWWATMRGMSEGEVLRREQDAFLVRLTSQQFTNACALTVSPGEFSALARRRSGTRMQDVADRYGVTRMTLWKMEHDLTESALALARWWRRRGFPAPRATDTLAMTVFPGVYA